MKSNMKKILVLATLLMLVSLVFANTSKAATTELKNNLSVSSASGEAGKEVKVNITATADLSVEEGGLLLKYDAKKLQYVSSTKASVEGLTLMANNKEEGFLVAFFSEEEGAVTIKKGTILATITFKIAEGTKDAVNLTLVDEEADNQPTLATGKVTIATANAGTTQTPSTGTAQTPSTNNNSNTGANGNQNGSTNNNSSTGTNNNSNGSTSNNNSSTTTKPTTSTTTTTKPASTTTASKKKDTTPKTGVVDIVAVAMGVVAITTVGLVLVVKKH